MRYKLQESSSLIPQFLVSELIKAFAGEIVIPTGFDNKTVQELATLVIKEIEEGTHAAEFIEIMSAVVTDYELYAAIVRSGNILHLGFALVV